MCISKNVAPIEKPQQSATQNHSMSQPIQELGWRDRSLYVRDQQNGKVPKASITNGQCLLQRQTPAQLFPGGPARSGILAMNGKRLTENLKDERELHVHVEKMNTFLKKRIAFNGSHVSIQRN